MSPEVAVALEITETPPPYDDEKPKATSEPESPPKSKVERCLDFVGNVLLYTAFVLICIVFVPLYLIYAGAAWLFCNIDVTDDESNKSSEASKVLDIFQKVHHVQDSATKLGKLPHAIGSRLVIFMMTWLTINLSVPTLRHKSFLGSKLWKWSLLVAVVSCGYHLISMLTRSLIYSLCSAKRFKKNKSRVYYIKGMRQSVNLVILSALILITWVSYFRTSHGIKKTDDTNTVLHVCTWSFVTLAVTAVLWFLKNVLLLKWEADAVYSRFRDRILIAGLQVYFLGHICGRHLLVFQPKSEGDEENTGDDEVSDTQDDDQTSEAQVTKKNAEAQVKEMTTGAQVETSSIAEEKKDKKREDEKKNAKDILFLDKHATLYEIKKMTGYFVNLCKVTSREDDGTSYVIKQCRKINEDYPHDKKITEQELIDVFDLANEDATKLYTKLKQEHNNLPEISYRNFEKSMVKAHNNCVALGHTLLDAREVVGVLNNVMTVLLFVIVFIAWLLLTDIATTKILVLIASPLLAVTFVFGDTCKKIFEGIIFSFINHPFDVGDRCIINMVEFEVRRMSVLTTTFVVIGTKEEALYPNSSLATIPIINLKGEPDPSDHVELTLGSNHTKIMLDELHTKINKIFEDDNGKKFEKANTIVVKEIGDCVKMEIQYEHVMSINEMTHSQCLKKKREQKSELLLQIKQLIEEINKKNKSDTTVEISQSL